MKRLLTILVTAALLFGAVAVAVPFIATAEETAPTFNTSTPSWLFDFTSNDLLSTFQNEIHMTHTLVKGEYTTFTATENDPYTWIQTPTCAVNQAGYAAIYYRTTAADRCGEFFCNRSDGIAMGQPGSNPQWDLDASGNWTKQIAELSNWKDAADSVSFSIFRIDPLQNNNGETAAGESIDIKYVAFFKTEADAQAFDYDEYMKKLAWEEEQKRLEEEAAKEEVAGAWSDPTYTEMETFEQDLNIGTLKYTPSADGKTMTISYEVAGETISYTVPNNQNYISGGYAGVDDLGRPLNTSEEVGSYKGDERYIGLFYFLWQGEHGDSGEFDMQKIIDELGVEGADNVDCGKYGPVGAMHFFAEPLYGYYYANDAWVLRKHAELLTNANIDFLYFDVTNGYSYINNAKKLMAVLQQLHDEGYDIPQVVFYTNSSAHNVVREVYNNIYSKGLYEDTWFAPNGKPIIIAPYDANIDDFFQIKQNQWPNDPNFKTDGWPWMDFDWPQRVFTTSDGDGSAISVSIAQHSGTVCFSHSSLYNNYTNRGRSYTNPDGVASNGPRFSRTLQTSYRAWKEDPTLTMQGLNFQAQFDHAIASDAKYILVTGWNEWVAQRQNDANGNIIFIDTASMEFSRDAEMMRGGYFDNYYMQLIYNVQKAKGTAPIVVQDSRKPINVTGEFDQWDDVLVTYQDPTGDTMDRNATGFGHKKYTNESGRNDIVKAKVTSDTKNVYFYIETVDPITMFDTKSSWMQIYVDVDADAKTGWYGYDFIINQNAQDQFTTTLGKYNGKDGAYGFASAGKISYRVKGNQMMIAVPQEMLGIENYRAIELQFKIADSETLYDEMEDFYCDGDVAPLGRLNYVYQNYIEGKSIVEDETEPVTEPVTDPETDPITDDVTEPATETDVETDVTEPEGCASVVISGIAVTMISLFGTALVLRKKD